MYKAFLEASTKIKVATACFIVGKLMFLMTAVCTMISDLAVKIVFSIYSLLIFSTIVLCIWEGFSVKKKTYKELEREVDRLRKMLDTER